VRGRWGGVNGQVGDPPSREERDSDIETMGVGSMVTTSAEKNFRARAHTTPFRARAHTTPPTPQAGEERDSAERRWGVGVNGQRLDDLDIQLKIFALEIPPPPISSQ